MRSVEIATGKIDIPEALKIDLPKVEVPSVSKSDMTLDTPNTANTVDVPVRTVDTAATVPAREPALVGAGGDSVVHTGDGPVTGSGSRPTLDDRLIDTCDNEQVNVTADTPPPLD